MHEHSYVNHLVQRIDTLMRENAMSRITGLTVRVGALSLFSPEHIQAHLEQAMLDRMSDNVDVRIVVDSDTESAEALEAVIETIEFEVDSLRDINHTPALSLFEVVEVIDGETEDESEEDTEENADLVEVLLVEETEISSDAQEEPSAVETSPAPAKAEAPVSSREGASS